MVWRCFCKIKIDELTNFYLNPLKYRLYFAFLLYLCGIYYMNMPREQVNRLKIVLAEEQKSNKWLAEQLGKDQATISKWVTNSSQPDLKNLLRIAKTLNVDVARLLNADVLNEEQQVNLQSATSDNMVLSENKEG